jgi:hypothetical protein
MFIFISVYNCKKIRAGVLGGLLKRGIARGENGIQYPNVTDPSKYTISNDFIFYIE